MKKLLLFVLAVMGFAACTNDPVEEQVAVRHDAPETITVGFEGDDTRIQLNEAQKTVWTKGDQVSVFYKNDANQKYEYRGETGARTAELHKVSAGSSTTKMGYVVVAYPYNEEYIISPASGNLETMLPAVQHYTVDSYGVGDNLMVSCSEFTQFSLKSVCGWLKLQLTGNGEVVKGIKFRGNNGEQVAGLIHVDTKSAEATLYSEEVAPDDNGNANGSLVIDGAMATEVMLYCDEGVTLSNEATAFYIALPPQTFEEGFTVDVICTDGTMMAKSSDKRLSIERNHIQPMAAFEFAATGTTNVPTEPENPVNPNLPSNENNKIYYTTTDGKKMFPYKSNAATFGAILISNIYQDGVGVMTFDDDVTKIGYEAFRGCTSLTSVTIGDSATKIGEYAFGYCDSLTSVNIPDSVTTIGNSAFYGCDSLTSVNIPDSVTTIGGYVFYSCTSLKSVTIGDSVTKIGYAAFAYCNSLTSVNIPDSVTTIGNHAFYCCTSLTSVNIPDSVTEIGAEAFSYCDSLTSVTIGDSVTVESVVEALRYCSSLQEFKGKFASEDGRCLIDDGVLYWVAPGGLTEYTIPDSVTTIGYYAFEGCTSLKSVNIPDSVTEFEGAAFAYCASLTEFKGKFASEDGRSLIVDNTIIAYANASGTTYTIPDSVTTIGDVAFAYCTSLTSVNIPDSVTTIGLGAFFNCDSLTSVTIGDSVTTIGELAFAYCASLTSVYCKATTPPSLSWSVFDDNGSGRKIYVPAESVEAYKSATNWSVYAYVIVGYDF